MIEGIVQIGRLLIFWGILSLGLIYFIPNILHAESLPTTPGWYEIPNTKLRSVCPPNNFGGSGYAFQDRCGSVTGAWNSAAFDIAKNRLLLFGGGHSDYHGNEVYALNLNSLKENNTQPAIERLTDPFVPIVQSGCHEGLPNVSTNQPNARHTYDGMVYIPTINKMLINGGALSWIGSTCSTVRSRGTWLFDLESSSWEKIEDPGLEANIVTSGTCVGCGYLGADRDFKNIPRRSEGKIIAYDPVTEQVYLNDLGSMYAFDPSTRKWTWQADNAGWISYNMTGIIDPQRRKFYAFGAGQQWSWDISNGSTAKVPAGTTGGDAIINCGYPGLTYDTNSNVIAGWCGGNTVWTLDPDTLIWTAHTFPDGPGTVWATHHQRPTWNTGTYKRFQYSPSLNAYILIQHADENAFLFRLNTKESDTIPPSQISALQGNANSDSQISLVWNPATDNVAISTYQIYRDGSLIGSSPTTNFSNVGLNPSTSYTYEILATDSSGNNGEKSTPLSITTKEKSNTGTSSVDADFNKRCQAVGVLKCIGFDTATELTQAVWPAPGLYPGAGNNAVDGSFDPNIKASGGGSLRFTIQGGGFGNSAGSWRQDFGQEFGPGSTFYVQWRQRFSPEMLTADFGGGGWKQLIIHHESATCANQEITFNNQYYRGFPQGYSHCGQRSFQVDLNNGDFLLEQDDNPNGEGIGYDCHYQPYLRTSATCAYYKPNEWMTFYVEVKVGDWGQSNTSIHAWVAYEGEALKTFVYMPNHNFEQNQPGTLWNYLTLLPYDTGKDGRDHPTAYTWYDELIISAKPIPAPEGVSPPQEDTSPPASPKNLQLQ